MTRRVICHVRLDSSVITANGVISIDYNEKDQSLVERMINHLEHEFLVQRENSVIPFIGFHK